ncbi:Y-family DNA polymerase [Litoribrevibacter albus]|uniref:DNA polymerase V subunit UmuC n=1 Tax=Litoribrevibacter albus TaxID=1473156 RepID=A0AA37S6H8_9GAMM|nr:Y-family DNA polymerase [Litoribrevibacter albus]GLQ29585.1 DNA polymerase V subunit UmuC [Litoribrevibacter albus]
MYALVDCNSFFASCEQVFRPDLRGQPVVVLSNNDGCIVARSKEAKQLGIPDLQPYFKISDQLRQAGVHVFSSNYELYGDLSTRVMDTLKAFSPNIEVYSIDESFLDMSGHALKTLPELGRAMRDTIYRHVRLPVGVGMGATKTLAKLANHIAKKSNKCHYVCVIDRLEQWHKVFAKIPVHHVWGIGSRLSGRLADQRIYSVLDLIQQDPERMKKHYSVNVSRTITELQGIPCYGLDETPEPKKQIISTRSFGVKVFNCLALEQSVSQYASRACEKLRKEQQRVKTMMVFASSSRFDANYYTRSVIVPLSMPTNDSRVICSLARKAVRECIYKSGVPFARAGVGLIELYAESPEQLDAFTARQDERSQELMKLVDHINQTCGRVFIASQGIDPYWKMQRNLKSPAYTTRWPDLPIVKV